MKNPRYAKACGTPYPYDPAKAQALLAEAGYRAGETSGHQARVLEQLSRRDRAGRGDAADAECRRLQCVDRADRSRRVGAASDKTTDSPTSIMFFGPGGRVTALSGAYFAYAGNVGPRMTRTCRRRWRARAARRRSRNTWTPWPRSDKYGHDRAYSPGLLLGERHLVRSQGHSGLGPQPQQGPRAAQSAAARCGAAEVSRMRIRARRSVRSDNES